MPAGWMKTMDFSSDTVDRLREQIRARRQAQEGIGVIPEGVEWVPVGMPLDDAEFLQQRKLSTQEICRIFRVPPWVVGADSGGSLTYSNTEQQSLHFATYSLRPWLVVIEPGALGGHRPLPRQRLPPVQSRRAASLRREDESRRCCISPLILSRAG